MGVVWLARDEELERDVALKFLPEMIVRDPAVLSDLKRETRRSLELTHPHIVRIHDFVQDDRSACISMEYVDGDTLSGLRVLKSTKVFEAPELDTWVKQWCEAMDYAHNQARVVHCDLKPANLMVNSKAMLKITDFGIARSLSDSATKLTATRGHSGTLVYMSPQQLAGERPSHLDDIYSIGATLYELLTGKPPFYRGQIEQQIRERKPIPMAIRREELDVQSRFLIPQLWEETIQSCLAKNPMRRPQSAGELANRLNLGHVLELSISKIGAKPPVKRRTTRPLREQLRIIAAVVAVPVDIVRRGLASIKATLIRSRKDPFLRNAAITMAALASIFLLLYFASATSRAWLLSPLSWKDGNHFTFYFPDFHKRPTESLPIPNPTSAPKESPTAPTVWPTQQSPSPPAKIAYSSEDVDHLIDHVNAVRNSGNVKETLTELENRGAADDLTSAGLLAEMALLYEAVQDLDRAEQTWSKVLELGETSGALYELAERRIKELPPEVRPDRGLQPSREVGTASKTSNQAQSKFEEAKQAYQQRQLATARTLIGQAEVFDPSSPAIHNLRGEILVQDRDFDGAEAEFRNALQLDPDFYQAENNLANLAYERQATEKTGNETETPGTSSNLPSPRNNRTWQAWIGEFVRQFVSANQFRDVETNLAFYAPNVDYFDDHQKDQTYIRKDIETYNERWPVRHDSVDGEVHVQEKTADKEYTANLKLNYYAESTERAQWSKGQFAIDLDISIVDGVPRISGIKEKILRQQKGKLTPATPNTSPPLSVNQATPSVAGEKKSTLWSHNGSTVVLRRDGTRVSFVYRDVRSGLSGTIPEGTILFEGTAQGEYYTGKARRFKKGFSPLEYKVSGTALVGGTVIELKGNYPKRDDNGKIIGDAPEILRFNYIGPAE